MNRLSQHLQLAEKRVAPLLRLLQSYTAGTPRRYQPLARLGFRLLRRPENTSRLAGNMSLNIADALVAFEYKLALSILISTIYIVAPCTQYRQLVFLTEAVT